MKKFILALLLLSQPVWAADKPLVMEAGQVKQLPTATSLQLQAPTTANATLNLPHGTAPTSPADGDCWTTTSGFYCRINGSTVGPYATGTGAGSVTSVSVTTANGVSGSVATATTTPAITLTLGAITPTSVAASGTVTGSNLSGTNTGNQTITLTGDVTGSGTGSFASTLATVNATTGTFGSATKSLTVTANGKGLITSIAEQTVTPAVGSITGLGTGVPAALALNVGSAGAPVTFNGALGTPSSGTLTNATGLPISGLTASTATAIGVGSIELGHASDTTIARSGAGDITVEGNAVYRAGGTDVPVTDGGTGRSTSTTAYGLIAAGTTATGAHQTLAAGATTEILVGGGTSALPAWTTATGSGAPVRATSPVLVTPDLGTPSALTLTNATGLPTAGLAADAVTYAKMQNVSAVSKVLGRGSASGAGDPEELSVGLGLEISSTTIRRATGTSFPGSPATGDIFWRSDRAIEYYYDGARWLSTTLYLYPLTLSDALLPRTATTASLGRSVNPAAGLYDIYVIDVVFHSYISATSTWTLDVSKVDDTTSTSIASRTTAGDAAPGHKSNRVTVNAVVTNAHDEFELNVTLTSGASTLYCTAALRYRLVG